MPSILRGSSIALLLVTLGVLVVSNYSAQALEVKNKLRHISAKGLASASTPQSEYAFNQNGGIYDAQHYQESESDILQREAQFFQKLRKSFAQQSSTEE